MQIKIRVAHLIGYEIRQRININGKAIIVIHSTYLEFEKFFRRVVY